MPLRKEVKLCFETTLGSGHRLNYVQIKSDRKQTWHRQRQNIKVEVSYFIGIFDGSYYGVGIRAGGLVKSTFGLIS